MTDPYWQLDGSQLYQGNVLDVLAALADRSVHMVATSPPYYGLRDYGLPPVEWPAVSYAPMAGLPPVEIAGCDPGCEHEWGEEQIVKGENWEHGPNAMNQPANGARNPRRDGAIKKVEISQGSWCSLCGGWRGCLGLEPTVEMFVGHIVLIWRELKRVLRDDGTCWLNFGDSYASSGQAGPLGSPAFRNGKLYEGEKALIQSFGRAPTSPGLKPKDLIGVPWRVAFALQADGWYLRSDIIWAKGLSFCAVSGSCMPESVTDRPTKGHEYVFLLAKSKSYFYDGDAVRESLQPGTMARAMRGVDSTNKLMPGAPGQTAQSLNLPHNHGEGYGGINPAGRNLRTVWAINPGSYAGAHFATFPPALVEPMIKAGTSECGCCPECGAQWERVTKREGGPPTGDHRKRKDFRADNQYNREAHPTGTVTGGALSAVYREYGYAQNVTTGWRPTCQCDAGDPVPCTILDPFGGSGTSADVARKFGRRWILIELSQAYCDDHIIPRLSEPLLEWAEKQDEPDPEPIQLELL